MLLRGVNFPHKNGPIPRSPINITTMVRQHTKFPPTVRSPRQTWQILRQIFIAPQLTLDHYRGAAHYPDISHCVWYLFDPKVTRGLGLGQGPSDSECSALTHFSMSIAHKYINLKEPYNQDINEQVTTKKILKKKADFTWNFQPQRHSIQTIFFKFNPPFLFLTFQIIYQ